MAASTIGTSQVNAVIIGRWNNDTPEPIILESAIDVSDISWIQRSGYKEFFTFVGRSLLQRCSAGTNVIDHEGYHCHVILRESGLGAVAITGMGYPARVAVTALRSVLTDFDKEHATTWRAAVKDGACPCAAVGEMLAKMSNPGEIDKLSKVQASLDETKDLMVCV